MISGVLVIDKPRGPTSHDVVAAARRALREKRIGHTGTLDPLATGVLPLACGPATRLVRFLTASDKEYEADVRLGLVTDTYDVTGREVSRSDVRPSLADVEAATRSFVGTYLQSPPPYSAKKIDGQRAYALARAEAAVQPPPVSVTVSKLEIVELSGDVLRLRLTCSAGFYVRSLAVDLGARLGTGGCLAALRRLRSGQFGLAEAVALDELLDRPAAAVERIVPLEGLLPEFPAARLTPEGARWVAHGRDVGPAQFLGPPPPPAEWVRLLSADGALVALAEPAPGAGSLHPSVVLT